jgi:hypothetical protein
MSDPERDFIRTTIGTLAHQMRELSAYVGVINAILSRGDIARAAAEALAMNEGLEELHASIVRVSDAFPPPPESGKPARGQ